MNIIKNIRKDFQLIGGVREHLRHPLICKWKGHSLYISLKNKKCVIRGIFHAALMASPGILGISIKLLTYRKVTVIGLAFISSGTFYVSYILQTLAWKVHLISKWKEPVSETTSGKEVEKTTKEFDAIAFQNACEAHDADLAMKLLEESGNPSEKLLNQVDDRGLTPLHYSVMNFLPLVVEKLLNIGAEVNIVSKDGYTPLDIICVNNDVRESKKSATIIELLLSKGAEFSKHKEITIDKGLNTLHDNLDLKEESLKSLYKLGLLQLDKGFYYAYPSARPNLIKWLIEEGSITTNLCESNPFLFKTSEFHRGRYLNIWNYKEKEQIISYLLNKDFISKKPKEDLLSHSILLGYHKLIEEKKSEFEINVKREFQVFDDELVGYPFSVALEVIAKWESYYSPNVWMLIKENMKKTAWLLKPTNESLLTEIDKERAHHIFHSEEAKEQKERTLLQKACVANDADLAMKLLEEGEDPSIRLHDGTTALHLIVCCQDQEKFLPIMEKIIKKHPGMLDWEAFGGLTPLHLAVEACSSLIVEKLLSLGIEVNKVSGNGRTALDMICEKGPLSWREKHQAATIIELLLDKGAQFARYKTLHGELHQLHQNNYLKDESFIHLYKLGLYRSAEDKNSKNLINCVFYLGHYKLVKWLIEEGKMGPYVYDNAITLLTQNLYLNWNREEREKIVFYLLDSNHISVEAREQLFYQASLYGFYKIIEKMMKEFKINEKTFKIKGIDYPFNKVVQELKMNYHYQKDLKKTAQLLKPTDESLIPDDIKALALKYGL